MKKAAIVLLAACFLLLRPKNEVIQAGTAQPVEDNRYIAITFDDGPKRETTSLLLEGLSKRGVQATFFLIGEQIPGNEDLVRQMALAGHQIGSHTFHHVMLSGATEAEVCHQVRETRLLLNAILETEGDWWLRPPYGLITEREAEWIDTPMIQWTIDPEDWKNRDAAQIEEHIVKNAKSGDIILLHDIYPTSVEAALNSIDRLQDQGFVFITVEELFRHPGITPEAGMLYMNPRAPVWSK